VGEQEPAPSVRGATEHQQLEDLPVARLGDPAQARLATGGILPRRQAESGGELPRRFEQTDVHHRCRDQRRVDRTDTGDGRQTAGGLIGAGMRNDLGFEGFDPFTQIVAVLMQSGDRLFGNVVVLIDKCHQFVELSYAFRNGHAKFRGRATHGVRQHLAGGSLIAGSDNRHFGASMPLGPSPLFSVPLSRTGPIRN
jgi:hypothetical protein